MSDKGSGCSSVGRAINSDTKSSHSTFLLKMDVFISLKSKQKCRLLLWKSCVTRNLQKSPNLVAKPVPLHQQKDIFSLQRMLWMELTIFCWSQNPLNWSTHSKLISQNSKWLSCPLHPTSVQFFNESLKSVKNSFCLFLHEVSCYSASPDNDRESECYLGTQPLKSPKTQKAEIETTR